MIPPIKSYTTIPAAKISEKISAARPEFPTVISDLISRYAVTDFTDALKPLNKNVNDVTLNRAIQDAFASPECDPQIKVDIIYLAIEKDCHEKLRVLIAELLDRGQDVYMNNTKFSRFGIHLDWLFMRKNLLGKATLLPNFGKVHFTGADLCHVSLQWAYLPGANFKGARFSYTSLNGSYLFRADFSDTRVLDTHFQALPKNFHISEKLGGFYFDNPLPTNLSYATFCNSDVTQSNFSGAILDSTDFVGARNLDKADFSDTDLRTVMLGTPPVSTLGIVSTNATWRRIYLQAYNKFPSPEQLAGFSLTLSGYHPDALLPYAEDIGKLNDRFADFLEFSTLPGGQNCDKNLWLIEQGIRPAELAAYNQFRSEGQSRDGAVKLVKGKRLPT